MTRSDVLVGAGDLVDHAGVFAALDAGGLRGEVGGREFLPRPGARHPAARAVAARGE